MEKSAPDLVTVLGHTAAGKTRFAACLASRVRGEIISADSRQVYRGMDIGTGKDYGDYLVEGKKIPVHLIDILDAGYEYNVYLFKNDFQKVFTDITDRRRVPVLCGGSGMYIESVLRNYQMLHVPVNHELRRDLEKKEMEELKEILKLYGPLHNVTDTVNRKRIIRAIEIAMHRAAGTGEEGPSRDIRSLVLGIRFERINRRKRITERLSQRLKEGLVEEVEGLLQGGIPAGKMEYYGLEYRMVTRYLRRECTYDEMFSNLNSAIHQFAKRQMTYFRGMERRGVKIEWLEGELPMEAKMARALDLLREAGLETT